MKRIFSVVLSLVLCFAVVTVLSGCAGFADLVDGFDGDGAKYLIYESNGDGTCTVTGTSKEGYKKITIPEASPDGERVVDIGDGAFAGDEFLRDIIIPDSVTEVGERAFEDCALDTITVGRGIEKFGAGAFRGSVAFSTYVSDLVGWCGVEFEDMEANPLYISENLHLVGSSEPVEHLNIPEEVTVIKEYAFAHCWNIYSVTIPGTVKTIEENAFFYCNSINTLTISDGVESIARGAFAKCNQIYHLTLPFLGGSLDDSEHAYLDYIFESEENLEDTENYDYIPSPRSLVLTGGETIAASAFDSCELMERLVLPASIKYIGEGAFEKCEGLKEICISDVDAWCNIEFVDYPFSSANRATLLVLENGQYVPPVEIVIGEGVTSVPSYAFYNVDSIERVVIPEGVTSIGQDAFNSCSGLKTITLPRSLEEIGNWALACDLTDVYYAGTEEEWDNVSLLYHEGIFQNTTIHFGGEAEE